MRKQLWHPVELDDRAAYAVQALAKGEATDAQQKFFLDWLIKEACQTYEEVFVPDNQRVTDYVAGRRSVGLALVKHVNVRPDKLSKQGDA